MSSPPLSTQLSTITSSELAISFSLGKVCIVRAVCESCNSQTPNYLQLWGCPKIRGHKTSKIHHFLCGNQWFGVFLCPKLRGIPHFWTNLMQSSKKPTRNHPSWNERRKVTKVTKSARLSQTQPEIRNFFSSPSAPSESYLATPGCWKQNGPSSADPRSISFCCASSHWSSSWHLQLT